MQSISQSKHDLLRKFFFVFFLAGQAAVVSAADVETPLQAYRRAVQANDFETVRLSGQITSFDTPNVARLNLTMLDLQALGIHSLDLVNVTAGSIRLRARLLSPAAYKSTVQNRDSRISPDWEADSYLVFDPAVPAAFLRLVGSGSSLVEAIKGAPGMPVELSVTRIRATPAAKIRPGG